MGIIRFLIIIFELIICYVLQSSVCGNFTLNHTMPDLMMIIVVTVAYLKGSNAGILYGFCAGMILDLTYGTHLGFGALLYLLAGFLAGLFHKFYRKDDNITPLLLIAACLFLQLNVYYITEFVIQGKAEYSFYLMNIMLPKIVYTVLVGSVLYKLCQLSIYWSIHLEERT
mgnify:FL=1